MIIDKENIENKKHLGSGKMADVYRDEENNKALKIYKEGENVPRIEPKLLEMENDGFVFPEELVYDKEDNLVGYSMEYVDGTELMSCIDNLSLDKIQDCISELEKEVDDVSENGVTMFDSHEGNYFWDKENEKIKIIDTELYNVVENKSVESNRRNVDETLGVVIGLDKGSLSTYINNNFAEEMLEAKKSGKDISTSEMLTKIKEKVGEDKIETLGDLKKVISEREKEECEKINEVTYKEYNSEKEEEKVRKDEFER